MKKLIFASRNFANAPKNLKHNRKCKNLKKILYRIINKHCQHYRQKFQSCCETACTLILPAWCIRVTFELALYERNVNDIKLAVIKH